MTNKTLNVSELDALDQPEDRVQPQSRPQPSAPSFPIVRTLPHPPGVEKKTWFDKLEAFVSGLSVRDTFWHRICSLIWLPLAFFSGIQTRQIDAQTFTAILPFRRFNRNFYRAMAGGALLANSEIAGGMYVFGVCGADYTVVCKNLQYDFLRPCHGPAIYKMSPREDLKALIATKGEFNVTLDLDILQQVTKIGQRDRRVGKCVAVFHVTPKVHHKIKKLRRS